MDKKATKFYSEKQEKAVADALGWSAIGGSGAAPCAPGDVKSDEWLCECKTHASEHRIFFDKDVWVKIKEEAYSTRRKPVLIVDDGSQDLKHTWCLCNKNSINLTSLLTIDLPYAVRKNISFDDSKAKEFLKVSGKPYIGECFIDIIFSLNWADSEILVMPFSSFKELHSR